LESISEKRYKKKTNQSPVRRSYYYEKGKRGGTKTEMVTMLIKKEGRIERHQGQSLARPLGTKEELENLEKLYQRSDGIKIKRVFESPGATMREERAERGKTRAEKEFWLIEKIKI